MYVFASLFGGWVGGANSVWKDFAIFSVDIAGSTNSHIHASSHFLKQQTLQLHKSLLQAVKFWLFILGPQLCIGLQLQLIGRYWINDIILNLKYIELHWVILTEDYCWMHHFWSCRGKQTSEPPYIPLYFLSSWCFWINFSAIILIFNSEFQIYTGIRWRRRRRHGWVTTEASTILSRSSTARRSSTIEKNLLMQENLSDVCHIHVCWDIFSKTVNDIVLVAYPYLYINLCSYGANGNTKMYNIKERTKLYGQFKMCNP